ncbi:leucine-rich repeat-containing protein 59 [Leptopilina boulardi]|uniref:leucine-rich repeat-containing protein 59 n=1 Tax=Leptopilina boulardi TaxID=63433 RepID=UPI0021F60BB6|nr:leucine-rich repeat-containing protein 59 [Leptopilina boulardi]XP_051161964.1 leucine-rich repeat-containing protein 59 [Leptopilina boulardi]
MTKINVKDKLQDETLDLSLCDIEEVPVKEIAAIRRAKHLDLSNNALISLPRTFVTLTQVIKLDLSKNMLTEIPENFGEMIQLKHLDLYGNKISRLPLSLGNLKNLKWLDLKENPLTPAVASVAGPCSNANECQACARKIVTYLSNVQLTIEEEKQRRINAISEAEKTVAPKKEGKKKKKNAEKIKAKENIKSQSFGEKIDETDQNDGKYFSVNESQKRKSKNTKGGGICSTLCRSLLFLFLWTIFFCLLIVLGTVVFPVFDNQRTQETIRYLETETGLPISHYQQIGKKTMEKFINDTTVWSNKLRVIVQDYYKQYFLSDK